MKKYLTTLLLFVAAFSFGQNITGTNLDIRNTSKFRVWAIYRGDTLSNCTYLPPDTLIVEKGNSVDTLTGMGINHWTLTGNDLVNNNTGKVTINADTTLIIEPLYAKDSIYLERDAIPFLGTNDPLYGFLTLGKLDASTKRQLSMSTFKQAADSIGRQNISSLTDGDTSKYLTWVRDTTLNLLKPVNTLDTVYIPQVLKLGAQLYAPEMVFTPVPSTVMDVLVKNQTTGLIHTYPIGNFTTVIETTGAGLWTNDTTANTCHLTDTTYNVAIGTNDSHGVSLYTDAGIFIKGGSGDFNEDGNVDVDDLDWWANNFGNTDSIDEQRFSRMDMNGDGSVNYTDFNIFSHTYPSFPPFNDKDSNRLAARVIEGTNWGTQNDSTFIIVNHLTLPGLDSAALTSAKSILINDINGNVSRIPATTYLQTTAISTLNMNDNNIVSINKATGDTADFTIYNNLPASLVEWADTTAADGVGIATYADVTALAPNIGYTIPVMASGLATPTDATTYYFGGMNAGPSTSAAVRQIKIFKSGVITGAQITALATTTGTDEVWTVNIRLNNTTDYAIATVGAATSIRSWTNAALTIAVSAGDYIEIKTTTPTWATDAAGLFFGGYIFVKTP
jgi:hypothetical protein